MIYVYIYVGALILALISYGAYEWVTHQMFKGKDTWKLYGVINYSFSISGAIVVMGAVHGLLVLTNNILVRWLA